MREEEGGVGVSGRLFDFGWFCCARPLRERRQAHAHGPPKWRAPPPSPRSLRAPCVSRAGGRTDGRETPKHDRIAPRPFVFLFISANLITRSRRNTTRAFNAHGRTRVRWQYLFRVILRWVDLIVHVLAGLHFFDGSSSVVTTFRCSSARGLLRLGNPAQVDRRLSIARTLEPCALGPVLIRNFLRAVGRMVTFGLARASERKRSTRGREIYSDHALAGLAPSRLAVLRCRAKRALARRFD